MNEQRIGRAGVLHVRELIGGEIQSGKCEYDLLCEGTQYEIKTSLLGYAEMPGYDRYRSPAWTFSHFNKSARFLVLVGSFRMRAGHPSHTYYCLPDNWVIPEFGEPLIVDPWIFIFQLEQAIGYGLKPNSTIRYAPFYGRGEWRAFLDRHGGFRVQQRKYYA
jgi:hypothetical protein